MSEATSGNVRPLERPGQAGETCPHCERWRLDAEDQYCSLCGASLFGVELQVLKGVLISGLGSRAGTAVCGVQNSNDEPVTVVVTPVGRAMPGLVVDPVELEVPAGTLGKIELRLDEDELPEDLTVQEVEFLCRVNNDRDKVLPFQVKVKAGPKPRVLTREVHFGQIFEDGRAEGTIQLENAGAVPLGIESVEPYGTDQLLVVGKPPRHVAPGQQVEVAVAWDASRAASEEDAAPVAGFAIDFSNSDEAVRVPARARLERIALRAQPDVVRVDPVVAGKIYKQTVAISNVGTTEVEIASLEAEAPWLRIGGWKGPEKLTAAAAEVGGGVEGDATGSQAGGSFSFELEILPEALGVGQHEAEIKLVDRTGGVVRTVPVEIQVVETREYPHFLGIDFGTTNSVVAYLDPERPRVRLVEFQPAAQKHKHLLPSVLSFKNGPDDYVIGQEARHRMAAYADQTIRSVKSLLGTGRRLEVAGRELAPEEVAGRILKELVQQAERHLFENHDRSHWSVERAIMTVPAGFFDLQVRAILEACVFAGLDQGDSLAGVGQERSSVDQGVILDEPSAAALFYLMELNGSEDTKRQIDEMLKRRKVRGVQCLIFDHGGGTLDVSVAELIRSEAETYEIVIKGTTGSNRVGGDQIDFAVLKRMLEILDLELDSIEFKSELITAPLSELKRRAAQEGWDAILSDVLRVRGGWKDLAEGLKITLSETKEVKVPIPAALLGRIDNMKWVSADKDGSFKWKRDELESSVSNAGVLREVERVIREALSTAGVKQKEIDFIIHVGRQSQMPVIQRTVKGLFPDLSEDHDILDPKHLKVCVAQGAALYGYLKEVQGDTIRFRDQGRRLPASYGLVRMEDFALRFHAILEKGNPIPAVAELEVPREELRTGQPIYKNGGSVDARPDSPDIRAIGRLQVDVDGAAEEECTVRFQVGDDRMLRVEVDGQPVEVEDLPREEGEEDWLW